MLHSHEALDRAGGYARAGLLAPLRERDFRLLWSGMCVSLVGDGAFLVALAWQVYTISDTATAMSLVGIAMTVPTIVFLLVGGVASDRFDRRRIMLAADLVRAAAVGLLAVLSLTGALEIWHIVGLVVFYGAGAAFFAPAFDAIVPELVPPERLAQANALDQMVRPIAMRLAGPALGGVVIGAFGTGTAFALDAGTFLRVGRRAARDAPACAARAWLPRSRCAATCARAGASCAAARGCGRRSRARRSHTCCSWAPSRSSCRCSSSTS